LNPSFFQNNLHLIPINLLGLKRKPAPNASSSNSPVDGYKRFQGFKTSPAQKRQQDLFGCELALSPEFLD
jgi:hypothetical protein